MSNLKKYIAPTVGVAAFVLGGLIARSKALDAVEVLEKTFTKKTVDVPVPNVK